MSFEWLSLIWLAPAAYAVATVSAFASKQVRTAWQWASCAAVGVLLLVAVLVPSGLLHPQAGVLDAVRLIMIGLVALLGWVVTTYSRRYLDGEPGQINYVAVLMLTLASVGVVVLADHLLVLLAGWIVTSIGIHRLLTFYSHRPVAVLVAHKKFLASRLAEAFMLAGIVLIYAEADTFSIESVSAYVNAQANLPWRLHAAAVLLACGVLLKSAQLPVHGWLIQVMEAPTPVSALLHAGVVNLGGFVLIRLATLIAAAPLAQTLLIVVGGFTAIIAGLVMMTRISIKVRLAWSTCAQMGFMLLECGLGLYELALLHLVAHSIYKAYAFLSAGDTVLHARRDELLPSQLLVPRAAVLTPIVALVVSLTAVLAAGATWAMVDATFVLQPVVIALIAIAFAPLLWAPTSRLRALASVFGLSQLYMVWHVLFGHAIDAPASTIPVFAFVVGCSFAVLYALQTYVLTHTHSPLAAKLYRWAYAGLYLDERFTRMTFRLWPARLPMRAVPTRTNIASVTAGENA